MKENIKQTTLFLLKATTFSLIFWGVWMYGARPMSAAQPNKDEIKSYMGKVAAMIEEQQRMDALFDDQEQQSKRLGSTYPNREWDAKTD